MSALVLKIVTPEGEMEPVPCDSVTVYARDNERGEGGGSMGIRRGHIEAVAALETNSQVRAYSEGKLIASFTVSGGFASIKNNTVTVITETVVRSGQGI